MDNFSELIKEAIAGGDDLESAMRKSTNISLHSAWIGHLEDSSAIAWHSSRRK